MGERADNGTGRASTPFLEGLRVVELGRRVATGMCGALLAALGAEVVLVEPRDHADADKWANPIVTAASKSSVAAPAGDELAALLIDADIVLLSTDLDRDQIDIWAGPRPASQVICDLTGFGLSGPLAGRACSAQLIEALAGCADTTGDPAGPPTLLGAPFLEMEAAVYATVAVLAALRVRRRQGQGQRIEVAVYDVAVNALATFIPLPLTGRRAARSGNHHPTLSPWNSFAARDGDVVICAPTDDLWRRLCEAMGRPALAAEPRFATTTARMENVEQIDAELAAWVGGLSVEECVSTLAAHVVPAAPVVEIEDLPREANIVYRGLVREIIGPDATVGRALPLPLRVDGGPLTLAPTDPGPPSAFAADDLISGDELQSEAALAGLRIVEIGMNTVAPLAGRQLGALGADVIKVEPPGGDSNRYNAPLREDGGSYIYAISNTDKRGAVLDLREEADKEVLWRLLDSADALIENLKPGSLGRLGFGAEAVRARFPDLVYCSINGFGHDSVYPGRPALDTVIQAMSGAMSATLVDGVPTKSGISIADQLGGLFGLLATVAALERRDHTGEGATLDLAMQECAAWATQMCWDAHEPRSAHCRIQPAADGHVVVEGEASAVRAALSVPAGGWTSEVLARLSRDEVVARLDAGGCAAAPVLTVAEVMEHEQTKARDLLVRRRSADGDEWLVLESPMRLHSTPARVRSAMAALGHRDPGLDAELGLLDRAAPLSRAGE